MQRCVLSEIGIDRFRSAALVSLGLLHVYVDHQYSACWLVRRSQQSCFMDPGEDSGLILNHGMTGFLPATESPVH